MNESAVLFGDQKSLVGIVTDPDAESNGLGLLFMNAGFTHHVGPQRMYVRFARQAAEMGFTSLRFDQVVPAGATITSVRIFVEHYEEDSFGANGLRWDVGTGALQSPAVLGSTLAPINEGASLETTDVWDVSSLITTPAGVNDMKLIIRNQDILEQKKTFTDHVYVVVDYVE